MRINALVSKAQKKPEEGWVMQDGTPWPGNNTRDHPGMIQVSHDYIRNQFFIFLSNKLISDVNRKFLICAGIFGK